MPLWRLVSLRHLSIGQRVSAIGVRILVARPWARGNGEPTEEELRRTLGDVSDALRLDPFGAATVQAIPIRVEGAPVRYTMTGLMSAEPEVARARVVDVLRALHFHLRRQGAEGDFLGWQATAVRGRITLTAAVGADGDDDQTPFRHLTGASYVQLTAG